MNKPKPLQPGGQLCVCRRQTCISGSKCAVLGDRFLERANPLVVAKQATLYLESACAQLEIVRFGAGFITAAAAPYLEAKIVYDAARNLVSLNRINGRLRIPSAQSDTQGNGTLL